MSSAVSESRRWHTAYEKRNRTQRDRDEDQRDSRLPCMLMYLFSTQAVAQAGKHEEHVESFTSDDQMLGRFGAQ